MSDARHRAKELDSVQGIAFRALVDKICHSFEPPGKALRFSRLAAHVCGEPSGPQPRRLGSGLHYPPGNTDEPNALESPERFHADFFDGVTGFRISSSSEAECSALAHAARQRAGDAGWGDPPLLRGRKINFSRLYPRLKTRRPEASPPGHFLLKGRAILR